MSTWKKNAVKFNSNSRFPVLSDDDIAKREARIEADYKAQQQKFKEANDNESRPKIVPTISRCEPAPLVGIQREVKNMIAEVQRIQKTANDWETKVSTKIDNVEAEIDKITDNAIKDITADVKKITQGIQENAINKVNESLSKTFDKVYPSQLGELKNNNSLSKIKQEMSTMEDIFKLQQMYGI